MILYIILNILKIKMTTLFQIILTKKNKQPANMITNHDKNTIYLSDDDFYEDPLRNVEIIENNVKLTREILKQLTYANNNQINEYYFTTNNSIDDTDSKIIYIQSNIPIDEKLLLEYKQNDFIDVDNKLKFNVIEDYNDDCIIEEDRTDVIEEYIKYYKIGENEPKDFIFKTASELSSDINILTGLLDGIIARDDNILNGFIKQYKHYFDEEILFPALEHAILLDKIENAKTIAKYIPKNSGYLDFHKNETIKFLKIRNIPDNILNIIENI